MRFCGTAAANDAIPSQSRAPIESHYTLTLLAAVHKPSPQSRQATSTGRWPKDTHHQVCGRPLSQPLRTSMCKGDRLLVL